MADLASVVSANVRAPSEVTILRDGEPDLIISKASLLLTTQTRPRGQSFHGTKRWKVYRLYKVYPGGELVVAEEGHSEREDERIRYSAYVCDGAVEAWRAMGKLDELKKPFAQLGLAVVERL